MIFEGIQRKNNYIIFKVEPIFYIVFYTIEIFLILLKKRKNWFTS